MKVFEYAKEHVARIATLAIVILIFTLVFGPGLKLAILVLLVILLGALSTLYYNFFHGPVNFELVKFGTIMLAVTQGWLPAILAGTLASIFGRVISGRIDHRLLISIIGIIIMSIAAQPFTHVDIRILGIGLVLLYHAVTLPISLAMGDRLWFVSLYVGSNIFFNTILFIYFGPIVQLAFA
jgi:hypothetical protein